MSLQSNNNNYKSDYQKLLYNYNELKNYTGNLEKETKELNKEVSRLKKEINELYLLLVVKVDREVKKNNKNNKGFS